MMVSLAAQVDLYCEPTAFTSAEHVYRNSAYCPVARTSYITQNMGGTLVGDADGVADIPVEGNSYLFTIQYVW